jgi:predicted transglutaminase-like cysteine proteinase
MGLEDAWSLPIDVNKEGSFNAGAGDCEDYVLAKYAALHQAGVPDENLRMVQRRWVSVARSRNLQVRRWLTYR